MRAYNPDPLLTHPGYTADISPSLACDSRAIASSESMLAFHARSKPVVWRGKGRDHGSLKGGDHGSLPAWPSSNLPHTHSTGSSPTLMMTDTVTCPPTRIKFTALPCGPSIGLGAKDTNSSCWLIVAFQGSTVASQAGTDVPPYSIQFKTAPVAPGAVRKDAGDTQKTVGSWKEEVARGNKSQKWILVRRAIDAVGDIWLPEGALSSQTRPFPIYMYKVFCQSWVMPGSYAHSLFDCLLF
jgi:hypothetical protein